MHSWVSSIGALDLDMELKVAREFSKSNAGSMRVVPVVTGEVLKAKYGDKAKFADFTVLDVDPQTIPAIKIKDVAVQATVLGGRVIPVSETKQPRPLP